MEVKLAEDPIVHECYNVQQGSPNDIALLKVFSSWSPVQSILLKLAEDVDLTVYTPACLPEPKDDYTGQMGNVYGESEKLVLSPASWKL